MILHGNVKRTWFALIVLLCFCVGMQMLGLPLTMWNPSHELNISENWDFSIPPSIPRLNQPILLSRLEMNQQYLHIPLLLHTEFHPPKSPQ
jgi:hypothetical protein